MANQKLDDSGDKLVTITFKVPRALHDRFTKTQFNMGRSHALRQMLEVWISAQEKIQGVEIEV